MVKIPYKIVYSKRRTLALQINQNAELVVKSPKRMSVEIIEKFIQLKQSWIISHQEKQQKKVVQNHRFEAGELFWYLGKEYPLVITNDYRSSIVFDNAFHLSQHKQWFAKKYFEDWYKKQAKVALSERLKLYARVMEASYTFGKITGANTRWGSCSHKNTINFTWKLIMAPLEVVDYVVIHELSHTVHKNHSARFWAHVAKFCPNCKSLRNLLHAEGHKFKL